MTRQAKGSASYIPTLDGWRAISILAVMALHDRLHSFGRLNDSWLNDHGALGVRIFFAISGILICGKLLQEEQLRGKINLRSFYVRRGFRILPPALLFLAFAAILIAIHQSHASWREWWAALLFYRNFFRVFDEQNRGWILAHFWSLSLEEQFYLFLPPFLVLAGRKRLGIMVALVAVLFAWSQYALHRNPDIAEYRTDIAVNVLLVPALAAILLRRTSWRIWIGRIVRPWPLYALLIYLSQQPSLFSHFGLAYHGHLYDQLLAFGMTALVLSTMLHPTIWLSRFLELAPLRWIGRISYSLYLWQQVFLTEHFAPEASFHWLHHSALLAYAAAFAAACASYYLLERPMMRLGHKLTSEPIPVHPDDSEGTTGPAQPAALINSRQET